VNEFETDQAGADASVPPREGTDPLAADSRPTCDPPPHSLPDGTPGRARVALLAIGLLVLAFGVEQLLIGGDATRLSSSLPWLVGVLVVHDALLAPAAAAVGWALTRVARRDARAATAVIAIGLYVAVVLTLLALPALLTPGVSDNPTAAPRDYSRGLAILLGLDAAVTMAVAALMVGRDRARSSPTVRPPEPTVRPPEPTARPSS
jgi:hypothetical protein